MAPYRTAVEPGINWFALAAEIADVPGGLAVLRVLQVHGVNHLVNLADGEQRASSSIEYLIEKVHEARR